MPSARKPSLNLSDVFPSHASSWGADRDLPGEVWPARSVRPDPRLVYARDAEGWVSPFPVGDPRCPLTGEFSDVGRSALGTALGIWAALICALVLAVGLGLGIWIGVELLGQLS